LVQPSPALIARGTQRYITGAQLQQRGAGP
jgi:hypothetical protein